MRDYYTLYICQWLWWCYSLLSIVVICISRWDIKCVALCASMQQWLGSGWEYQGIGRSVCYSYESVRVWYLCGYCLNAWKRWGEMIFMKIAMKIQYSGCCICKIRGLWVFDSTDAILWRACCLIVFRTSSLLTILSKTIDSSPWAKDVWSSRSLGGICDIVF